MSIDAVSFSSPQSLRVGSIHTDPASATCSSDCSFGGMMSSVPSLETGGQTSLTLHDGTTVSLQGNQDLGQLAISSLVSVKADGLSRAESLQKKIGDIQRLSQEAGAGDFASLLEKNREVSIKMIELQSTQLGDKLITSTQTNAIKKSGEGVQQLVKG